MNNHYDKKIEKADLKALYSIEMHIDIEEHALKLAENGILQGANLGDNKKEKDKLLKHKKFFDNCVHDFNSFKKEFTIFLEKLTIENVNNERIKQLKLKLDSLTNLYLRYVRANDEV